MTNTPQRPDSTVAVRYALHMDALVAAQKKVEGSAAFAVGYERAKEKYAAANRRLRERLDEYEKPLTDAESDETAWNIRLEAFAVAYMNLAECRCKHSCNHRDAYNDRRERIDFAINRLREDAELFRTVVEPRLKIFVYGLQPETRLQLEETWNFGTYATPRAFLRSLREQSTTRTTEGDK